MKHLSIPHSPCAQALSAKLHSGTMAIRRDGYSTIVLAEKKQRLERTCAGLKASASISERILAYISLLTFPAPGSQWKSGICWDALHSGLSMDMSCAWQGCELKESSMNIGTDFGIPVLFMPHEASPVLLLLMGRAGLCPLQAESLGELGNLRQVGHYYACS